MRADETESDGQAMPRVTLWLGLGGLVPFLTLAGAPVLGQSLPLIGGADAIRQALMIYAVAILSFLGGVRWGIAMGYADGKVALRDFLISVIPAILGWAAALLPLGPGLWLMVAAFVVLGLYDYGLACRTVAPEWYGRLRLALTAAASTLLAAAALA